MKRSIELMVLATAVLLFGFVTSLPAQQSVIGTPITTPSGSTQSAPPHVPSPPGTLIIPKSSQPQAVPAGHYFAAHTNVEMFMPTGFTPEEAPPYSGYGYETPASLACHYGLVTVASGVSPNCNPNTTTVNPTGGSQSIAIVDAFDDPEAPADLAYFSDVFGLPFSVSQFQVVWGPTPYSGTCPGYVPVDTTGGWEVEESLDIEYAHAMAPSAKIYLVEACSNNDQDLQQAVLVANNLVQCGLTEINNTGDPSTTTVGTCPTTSTGKGEVSMSWGGGEWSGETGTSCPGAYTSALNDGCLMGTNIVYFASSGDSPGTIWPGTSVNVVSAGGTTMRRNATAPYNFKQEAAWVSGGDGPSFYEPRPSYQASVSSIVGSYRGTPDLSFDADPNTGVWVYDTFPVDCYYMFDCGWYSWWIVGGTSVSSPALAGIVNRAGGFHSTSSAELNVIYSNKAVTADFTDITYGFCGNYMGFSTFTGYDFCTGVGVVNTYVGK